MTISFGNTQISLEDGNTAVPQAPTPAPAKKKGHGKLLLLAGLGVAGYIAAGGVSGIQGMVNGGSAAGKTIDTVVNANNKIIDTKLQKFGAIIGDNIDIGCNSVIFPGTIIYPNTSIYPLTRVRGIIKEDSIVKSEKEIVAKNKICK